MSLISPFGVIAWQLMRSKDQTEQGGHGGGVLRAGAFSSPLVSCQRQIRYAAEGLALGGTAATGGGCLPTRQRDKLDESGNKARHGQPCDWPK